jgi:uncharacterized protein
MVPVAPAERVESVDVLRGFSLLGILLLNIVSFGLPFAAYYNPSAWGGDSGANLGVWTIAMTFWDGKMRAIFSMLFGAGGVILLDRAQRRAPDNKRAGLGLYYRRTFWLMVFGLIHGFCIWYGDILWAYGVVGLLLYPLRKLRARTLLILGVVAVLLHAAEMIGSAYGLSAVFEQAQKAEAARTAGQTLTADQRSALATRDEMNLMFRPSRAALEQEIQTMRGSYLASWPARARENFHFQFIFFFQFMFLDVFAMLLLGMGLLKSGVLDASRSYAFYGWMSAIGFALGLPFSYWAADQWRQSGFAVVEFFCYPAATADISRWLVAAGYIGLIMMICKAGIWTPVRRRLAAVGRTALSNYLLTSVLCTLFFYGHGLGFYAKLQRIELYLVVLGMWVINLTLSPWWLERFRYGPAEWLWRSLTYWKLQPLRREAAA